MRRPSVSASFKAALAFAALCGDRAMGHACLFPTFLSPPVHFRANRGLPQ